MWTRRATGIATTIAPRTHRRIDQLTFSGLLATASSLARRDRGAAAVTLPTAFVADAADLTTAYPPAVFLMTGFRAHNRVATAHGSAVIALAPAMPNPSRHGRMALGLLGTMPLAPSAFSNARGRAR